MHHTLNEVEWKASQDEREKEADGLHLMFNFNRLIASIEDTRTARSNGVMDGDVMTRAMRLKYLHMVKALENLRKDLQLRHNVGGYQS